VSVEELQNYSMYEIFEGQRFLVEDADIKKGRVSYAISDWREKLEEKDTPELKNI
jgi:hypothetical protein